MSFGPATIIRPGAQAIIGVVGPRGLPGPAGTPGAIGPTPWAPPVAWRTALVCVVGPPATTVTINGGSYVCLAPHSAGLFSQDFAAGYWAQVSAPGANGAVWYVAAVVPSPFTGNVGDLFLNASTGDVYQKTAIGWGTPVANLKGPIGTAGNTIQNGTGAPSASLGANGDFYIDTTAGAPKLYGPKVSGSWPTSYASLVGPAGPANVLTVGTVTTGAAGSSAAASITGTSPVQVLNLTIPQGAGGAGATFTSININTLAYGAQATASLGGTAPSYTLTLGIPQGAPGQNGTGSGNVNSTGTITDGAVVLYSGTDGKTIKAGGTLGTAAFQASGAFASATTTVAAGFGLTGGGALSGSVTLSLSWPVNAPSGTSYTVQASDGFKLVKLSNAAAVAVTLPQAGASFPNGWETSFLNLGAGTVTITPTTSTINGAASLTLTTGQSADIYSDGSNYFAAGGSATAASAGGSGAPSAVNPQSLPYTATAADKGKQLVLTGTGALNLPAATAVSGWYAYVKKSDGNGVATITPASGTIEGLASIAMYQESYVLWYDAANGVFRTAGRPKGEINLGTTTVTSAQASATFTAGLTDPELRDMHIEAVNVLPSAADYLAVRVAKGGAYLSTGYSAEGVTQTNTTNNSGSSNINVPSSLVNSASACFADIKVFGFASTSPQMVSIVGGNLGNSAGVSFGAQTGTSGAITGIQVLFSNGANINSGGFNVKGFRP